MRPSNALTEARRLKAVEAATLALKKLVESPALKGLRENQVLASENSNHRATYPGIWWVPGFVGKSFDSQMLLLTPGGIVDHQTHIDGLKEIGPAFCIITTSPGTKKVLCHNRVAEETFRTIAEYHDLDAEDLENLRKCIES